MIADRISREARVPVRIKAVAFDFGNVLSRPQDPALVGRLEALAGLTQEELHRGYYRHRLAYDLGDLNGPAYWTKVVGQSAHAGSPAWLASLIETDVDSWLRFDEAMLAWVGGLKRQGIATAILSNMPPDILVALRQRHADVLAEFAVSIFSCEVGVAKPEPRIYELLIRQLGVEPSAVLFVDDREENVAAAVSVGMHGVRYESFERFRRDVEGIYELPLPEMFDQVSPF